MIAISVTILIAYLVTSAIVLIMGFSPSFPWNYMFGIGLFPIPFACYIAIGGIRLEKHLSPATWLYKLLGIFLGLLLVILCRFNSPLFYIFWLISIIFMAYYLISTGISQVKYLILSCIFLIVGYTVIRNLNYIALSLVLERLNDATLYKIDKLIYGLFLGNHLSYKAIFPLIKSKQLFNVFQSAYFILFLEMYIIVFININNKERLIQFIVVLFSCYIIGILIFIIYPSVGPYISYPNSFARAFHNSITYKTMQGIVSGYESVKNLTTPKNDIGYFVSFPSLHAAVAIILQYFVSDIKLHKWIFLPVNCLVILSTVFLGFHYIIDVPAGILLALFTLALFKVTIRKVATLDPFPRPLSPWRAGH